MLRLFSKIDTDMNTAIEIKKNIYWLGVNDRRTHIFENYWPLPKGVAYNSYVIVDEKTVVLDTVERSRMDDYLESLEAVLAGRPVDYLVVNHMEPDHSGAIKSLLARYPDLTVIGNAKTFPMLENYYGVNHRLLEVKEGDTLSLGQHTLKFIMAPMVHWPEVMLTYEESEKILFAADAFGKFGALCYEDEWTDEARRYYFNIVGKYGAQVQALLKKAAGLDIAMICPLHGPVLKEDLGRHIGLYDTWSKYEPETEGVLVAYASIHGNTAAAARKMGDILQAKGATVALIDLTRDDMAKAVESAFRFSKMIVAASSYDAGVFPPMFDFLHHLQIKNFQKRRVGIMENGSWAPSAGRAIRQMLSEMKDMELVEPVVTIRSRMKPSDETALAALADAIIG